MPHQKEQAELLARQQAELNAQMGGFFVEALNASSGSSFFNESLDQLGASYVEVGGLTSDQRESLSELQAEYTKIQDSIRSYASGIEGVGLTEDERNEKIAEQQARLIELEAVMHPLLSVTGELAERNVEATINQDAVNQALFDAAAASGASAVQLALLGGELGLYSEEALNAALQSALIQEKINALSAAYVAGDISVAGMREELGMFIGDLDAVASEMIQATEDTGGLNQSIKDATTELDNMSGRGN